MIYEVYVGFFDLWNAVGVTNYCDNVIEGEKTVAFDLCVDIFSLRKELKRSFRNFFKNFQNFQTFKLFF